MITFTSVAPGRWTTFAGPEWRNRNGGLWGGYAIGACIRVLEDEPEAQGEALSLTLSYASGLPSGEIEARTRRLRQGGSIGLWEVELSPAGSQEVSVHAVVALARRPKTPAFAFSKMPAVPPPEGLPALPIPEGVAHHAAGGFETRPVKGYPPEPGADSLSLAWVRSREAPMDKTRLGMLSDTSPPRAFYALGYGVVTTTLSLTVYLHASAEEIAEIGNDFMLVEYEGRVGSGGAADERSSYWSRDGRLLATSEQLAWYRPHVAEAAV